MERVSIPEFLETVLDDVEDVPAGLAERLLAVADQVSGRPDKLREILEEATHE